MQKRPIVSVRLYGVSRRRQQRRADKVRRHLRTAHELSTRADQSPTFSAPRVLVREASHAVRLAYTRSQASEALGISRSTLRRLLPYIDTIELPWGARLIPVDELERLATERRCAAAVRQPALRPGRKLAVASDVAKRIYDERSAGQSLRQITANLNADRIPTAHGGRQWWPSTVRAILAREGTRPFGSAP